MSQVQPGAWLPVCGGGLDMAGAMTVCASLGYPGVLDIGSSGQGIATPCRTSLCGTVASSNSNATFVCQAQGKPASLTCHL